MESRVMQWPRIATCLERSVSKEKNSKECAKKCQKIESLFKTTDNAKSGNEELFKVDPFPEKMTRRWYNSLLIMRVIRRLFYVKVKIQMMKTWVNLHKKERRINFSWHNYTLKNSSKHTANLQLHLQGLYHHQLIFTATT